LGHSVKIGLDGTLGLGNASFLSFQLLTELKRNHLVYLYQDLGESRPGILSDHLKSSEEIGLSGNLAGEWEGFCRALSGAGVQLQNKEDELIWMGGDRSGSLTVKNIYLALAKKKWPNVIGGWRRHMWKWDMVQKIKLFIWLSIENRILTWDTLQRKGWQGPNICHLCTKEVESVYHLFVSYNFFREVWIKINKVFNILTAWEVSTLSGCFENWDKKEAIYSTLPSILCWFVWMERNNYIFEGSKPSTVSIVSKVKAFLPFNPFVKKAIIHILQNPCYITSIMN
jgi:hypothetical protein